MIKADKSKPVLVTGATGYVAGCLVIKLLNEGFTVHAAVREKLLIKSHWLKKHRVKYTFFIRI